MNSRPHKVQVEAEQRRSRIRTQPASGDRRGFAVERVVDAVAAAAQAHDFALENREYLLHSLPDPALKWEADPALTGSLNQVLQFIFAQHAAYVQDSQCFESEGDDIERQEGLE